MQAYQSNQILVRSSASLQRDFLDLTSFCEIISQLLLIDMSADHCLTFNVGSCSLSLYQLSSIISTEAMSRFNKSLNISILQSHSQINRPLQYSIDKLSFMVFPLTIACPPKSIKFLISVKPTCMPINL